MNVEEKADYVFEGVPVYNLNENFHTFQKVLENGRYGICHFQEYSEFGGIEIPWFKKAKEHCRKVFFTFHIPYFTCYKGDFRYKGITDCDTFSNAERCAECVIADKIGYKKTRNSEMILKATMFFSGKVGARNKLQEKIKAKHAILHQLIATCDEVFVIASWYKKLLAANGYNDPNIKKIPNPSLPQAVTPLVPANVLKNKIIYVGRIQPQKGLHLLCNALHNLKVQHIQLDVYGNIQDKRYFEACLQNFKFNYEGTVDREILIQKLVEFDFLILPSVTPEMYPLVISDSFRVGLPVIASSSKGNKDLISDGVNGFLFDYDNEEELAAVIDKAYDLKESGWRPCFTNPENSDKDIGQIISYYR